MRLRLKSKLCGGEIREKRRFLWFPKCINREWRWLETASWVQRYCWGESFRPPRKWRNGRWTD